MKKALRAFLAAIVASVVALSGITSSAVMAYDNSYDDGHYVHKCDEFCLHNVDLTLLEYGITATDRVYLGNGVWVTRTTSISSIISHEQRIAPLWWCCSWPNIVLQSSTFCNCNGWNMISCSFFRRDSVEACLSCGIIFTNTIRTTTLPGCFFAFYGELGWRYPLNHPASRHINSGYKLTGRPDHEGIDIARYEPNRPVGALGAIMGEAVFAIHGGTVLAAQWSDSAGNWVVVRSNVVDPIRSPAQNIITRYLHLRDAPLVSSIPGRNNISQGVQIGNVGNTGNTMGSGPGNRSSGHLHIDINNNNRWTSSSDVRPFTVNPMRFFPNIAFSGQTGRVIP
jgi:hypothetical protein